MRNLFQTTSPSTFGNREGVLYPLFEGLDGQRIHYIQRKKEIEELITLLSIRVEAENEYSNKLFYLSDKNSLDSISIGLLSKEVDAFKSDCRSKAKAAAELAENVS